MLCAVPALRSSRLRPLLALCVMCRYYLAHGQSSSVICSLNFPGGVFSFRLRLPRVRSQARDEQAAVQLRAGHGLMLPRRLRRRRMLHAHRQRCNLPCSCFACLICDCFPPAPVVFLQQAEASNGQFDLRMRASDASGCQFVNYTKVARQSARPILAHSISVCFARCLPVCRPACRSRKSLARPRTTAFTRRAPTSMVPALLPAFLT